ncbi:MAG: hypothetical protein KBD94_11280 [Pyrinomonadaceae bacterium]|nr:hypothetical protein [Pyrinomonadaceae bacterium]
MKLEQLLWQIVADGVITNEEMNALGRFYQENALTADEFAKVRDVVFNQVVAHYTADRRITDAEENTLMQIGRRLGLSDSALSNVSSHINYFALLNTVETCALADLPVTESSGIILQRAEIDYLNFAASLLEERVVNRQIVGRSSGMSFRLMKGVSYRVGQSRGQILSQTGIVPISDGGFVVTNQRLIFSGDRKSVNAPLGKILDVDFYKDGLRFSLTNRQKPVTVQFFTEQSAELMAMYVSRVLNP